jgi:hypothetical protein
MVLLNAYKLYIYIYIYSLYTYIYVNEITHLHIYTHTQNQQGKHIYIHTHTHTYTEPGGETHIHTYTHIYTEPAREPSSDLLAEQENWQGGHRFATIHDTLCYMAYVSMHACMYVCAYACVCVQSNLKKFWFPRTRVCICILTASCMYITYIHTSMRFPRNMKQRLIDCNTIYAVDSYMWCPNHSRGSKNSSNYCVRKRESL